MLIIGCGNRQRGDDAAGVMAAESLLIRGIEAQVCTGEASELMEIWSGSDDVIVIDAVVTGAPVGTVHMWDGEYAISRGRSMGSTQRSTHGLGVAEAIELSRTLDRLPARLCVYGIEGQKFEIGSTVSPGVGQAVEEVVQRIVTQRAQGAIFCKDQ